MYTHSDALVIFDLGPFSKGRGQGGEHVDCEYLQTDSKSHIGRRLAYLHSTQPVLKVKGRELFDSEYFENPSTWHFVILSAYTLSFYAV